MLFAFCGILGLIVGPIVFWIERRGGEVGFRRSALFDGLVGLAVGGAIDLAGGLVTDRWSEAGFFTLGLPTLIGFPAADAGLFARVRRKRLAWSGKERWAVPYLPPAARAPSGRIVLPPLDSASATFHASIPGVDR